MPKPRSLLRTVGSISSATMVSRILGLVRDQVQSYFFGAGAVTDAFLAAYRIPNLLRDLFAEGALSAAFVPTFTAEKEHHGAEAAWRLANRVMTALALILGVLAVLIALGAPRILQVYVSGFGPDKMDLTITMTRILSPFLLFIALAAVAMGVLNTCGRFFLPALAPASFNAAVIVGVIALVPVLQAAGAEPSLSLAIGAVVGGALQFLVQVPAMHMEGFRFRPELVLRDPAVRRIAWLMLPATFGLAATQLNILVDTTIASRLGDGRITYLQLGFRLLQLPIGLFGVAIATANLARVSKDAARGDLVSMRSNLAAALRVAAMLALPATAGLIVLRGPVVRLLFEHGEFTPLASAQTAAAVLCYALGLFAYSVTKIQVPTFYALGETATPVKASVSAVLAKIATSLFLVFVVFPAIEIEPFLGLAISTSLAAWINFSWLGLALRRRIGPLRGEQILATSLKMGGLSVVMGFACHAFHDLGETLLPGEGILVQIVRVGTTVFLGVAIVAAGIRWLDLPEGNRLLARFRR